MQATKRGIDLRDEGDEAQSAENDDEDDDGRLLATFTEALAGLDVVCFPRFRGKTNANAESGLQCVEKELLLSKGQLLCPQKIRYVQD